MAQTVAGGTIGALGIRGPIFPENRIVIHKRIPGLNRMRLALLSTRCSRSRTYRWTFVESPQTAYQRWKASASSISVFPQIICGVFQDDVDARLAVAILEQILYHCTVFFALLLVPGACLGDDA